MRCREESRASLNWMGEEVDEGTRRKVEGERTKDTRCRLAASAWLFKRFPSSPIAAATEANFLRLTDLCQDILSRV